MSSFAAESSLTEPQAEVPESATEARASLAVCAGSLLLADLLSIVIVGSIGIFITDPSSSLVTAGSVSFHQQVLASMAALFAGVLVYLSFMDRYHSRIPFWSELRLLICTSWLTAVGLAGFSVSLGDPARCAPLIVAVLLFPITATLLSHLAKQMLARNGVWTWNILVIGEAPEVTAVGSALRSAASLGYRVVGHLEPDVIGSAAGAMVIRSRMDRVGARHVIIALGQQHPMRQKILDLVRSEHVDTLMAPAVSVVDGPSLVGASFLSDDALLMLVREGQYRSARRLVKILLDICLASVMLVALSPLFLAVALANIVSGGPVFYAHRRVGLAGKPFPCLKFRTMRVDGDKILAELLAKDPEAAREWAATRKLRNDPRVTRLGQILRQTSLDELPQLFNVLRLEMSLVGPRPIVDGEVPMFGPDIVHYYATRPGITGLWQVSGRSNTSYARRVELDVWYVKNWTIWNDVAVLLKTIPAVLAREGAN